MKTFAGTRCHLTLWAALAAIIVAAPSLHAVDVTIAWDAPTENTDGSPLTDLTGYKVYYGDTPTYYGQSRDVGNTTTFTASNLVEETRYYFSVTAYNAENRESTFASPLSWQSADSTPPSVESVIAFTETQVAVVFSETVTAQTAENTANYSVDQGIQVQAVSLEGNGTRAVLQVSELTEDVTYVLTVSGIEDSAGNALTSAQLQFTSREDVVVGLAAHWTFDDGLGTVVSDRIGGHDGAASHESWVNGIFNGALDFEADGDVVNAGRFDPATDDMTLSAWLRWDGTNTKHQMIICKRDTWSGDNMRWQFARHNGGDLLFAQDDSRAFFGVDFTETNAWMHVLLAKQNDSVTLYINGQARSTRPMFFGSGSNSVVYIGNAPSGDEPFNGAIDDLRIYDRALSIGEIEQLYDGRPAPMPPSIVTQPADQWAVEGDPVAFDAAATGEAPLTYQWRRNGVPIAGATATRLTIATAAAGDDGARFDVVVSNSEGSATSDAATLSVFAAGDAAYSHFVIEQDARNQTVTMLGIFEHRAWRELAQLRWTPSAPAGWSVTALAGDGNPVWSEDAIQFTPPLEAGLAIFTYTLSAPDEAALSADIGGTVSFRFTDMPGQTLIDGQVSPATVEWHHNADFEATLGAIGDAEASHVLSLLQAGGYRYSRYARQGFIPDLSPSTPGAGEPLHSADIRAPFGMLDATEANRVLAYWRAGAYGLDSDGADGYRPISDAGHGGAPSPQPPLVQNSMQNQYDPGSVVTITNEVTFESGLLSLAWRFELPAGWTVSNVRGDGSPVYADGTVIWTARDLTSPLSLVYDVTIPLNSNADAGIGGEFEYHFAEQANPQVNTSAPQPAALAPRDSDGDGLPDFWELRYGGSTTGMAAQGDSDNDGMTALQEWIAGTLPDDAESAFDIQAQGLGGGKITLRWYSQAGRRYTVRRAPRLGEPFVPIATGIAATPPVNAFTETDTGPSTGFYCVEVEP